MKHSAPLSDLEIYLPSISSILVHGILPENSLGLSRIGTMNSLTTSDNFFFLPIHLQNQENGASARAHLQLETFL